MFARARTPSLRGRLVCHCLLVETANGLVLCDTGFGVRDVERPELRLSRFFLTLLRPEFRLDMTAIRQVEGLGFAPRDVRHVLLTHLDFDHAGGLDDFPWATVHLLRSERQAAFAQSTRLDRMRYRPQQWSTSGSWRVHDVRSGGERWFGFQRVRALPGVAQDVLLVPLPGHTFGHAGIAVRGDDGWFLLAGDAYFFAGELDLARPNCPLGLRAYQWLMQKDGPARLANQQRLRELRRDHGEEVTIVSSHDLVEFERCARTAGERAAASDASRSPT